MQQGAPVTVRDEAGTVIATGHLDAGQKVAITEGGDALFCEFEFVVEVPAGYPFYAFEVADRGELTYSAAELETMGWSVELS